MTSLLLTVGGTVANALDLATLVLHLVCSQIMMEKKVKT